MTFQASDHRGNYFLELLDNRYLPIKGDPWLKQFGHLNSYVQEWLEQSLITLLWENIILGFSQEWTLSVHVDYIQLNQDNIFFMNAEDITSIGTWIGYF